MSSIVADGAAPPARPAIGPHGAARRGASGPSTRALRAVTGIALLTTWGLATLTGVLMQITPDGQGAGRQAVLGLTQRTWGDLHWWVCVAAVAVTVVHLALDWRTFRGCLRSLAHRTP